MPTESDLPSPANIHCPLLSLPNDIITLIVYELHPREAIYLSLTCRALYHGVLSDKNYSLWYRVGRFAAGMPGHDMGWLLTKSLDQIMSGPAGKHLPPVNNNPDSKIKAASKKPIRNGLVSDVVDYKKMLVETMLGDADTGCQWCLEQPVTKKIYRRWNLRLCGSCFVENAITSDECKPLEIDISHLPMQRARREGRLVYGIWKPAVQRLADEKYGDTKPVDERIPLLKNEKQAEIDAAWEDLAIYREKHFVVIFEEIKRQYQELYERHEKMGFTTEPFGRVLEKIPMQKLKLEWFMAPRRNGKYFSHENWWWIAFVKNDPLMRELTTTKAKEKWNDAAWVQEKATEKITNMQKLLSVDVSDAPRPYVNPSTSRHYWDIPSAYMLKEVNTIAREWHIKRAIDGEVDELIARMVAQNGKGIMCPWVHFSGPQFLETGTFRSFIHHLEYEHWDVFILGDTDWLVGCPSRWWLKNAVLDIVPGATAEDERNGAAWFSQVAQQARWLQTWWPERWKEEHMQVLQGWRDNGGIYGENVSRF